MGDRLSGRVWRYLLGALAVLVAFGGTSAAASGRSPSVATSATAVVAGSYAGSLGDVPAAVAVIAKAPASEGESRTISMYVCNGTSIAAWLTGTTTGNSATLHSADGRFGAQVSVTPSRAGGVFSITGGGKYRFVVPSVTPVSGLFELTIGQNGRIKGLSRTGATISGQVGTGESLPAKGTAIATVSAAGKETKLTVLGHGLTPGAYRWIVLPNGAVYGANKLGPRSGGIGGLTLKQLTGKKHRKISAGTAGQKGWNDAACQGLANKWDKLVESAGNDIANGNGASGDAKLTKAQGMLNTLNSKCMVTGIG